MSDESGFNWEAAPFFRRLTESSRLARDNGFAFHLVSGLEGFHGALSDLLKSRAFVCVSDASDGTLSIDDNTPHVSRVKTVFMAMRHKALDEAARQQRLSVMRELFRQFMSVLAQERTRLHEDCIYLDSRIRFTEIDRYFFTEAACAFFQIRIDTFTDLSYNPDEWLLPPIPML